jgi:NADPH:quinone reductase
LQRSGLYPPPIGASPYMGLEASGTIEAIGSDVQSWKLGDRVCALTNGGSYADYVCAAKGQVMPVPKGMGLLEAAAIPENYFTVFVNVFTRGGLKAGETILIHGGSSGIGLTAIQLAKAFGAQVYCTVGSADKQAACLTAGADFAFNYKTEDFVSSTLKLRQQGVDMVLDMVGGEYTDRNLKCLAPLGRLVQIAFLQGPRATIDMSPIMLKRLTFTGSTLRPRTASEKAQIGADLLANVWPLLEQRRALPIIYKVFDLSSVVTAHELMESSAHIGKIMLSINPD